jgi:hypothetical protein
MSKIKPGEHQRTPHMTDAGMYRNKPPRKKGRWPALKAFERGLEIQAGNARAAAMNWLQEHPDAFPGLHDRLAKDIAVPKLRKKP